MKGNKNVIIEIERSEKYEVPCIMIYDECNGVCVSYRQDNADKQNFENMIQIIHKISEFQQNGYSFIYRGFDKISKQ